MNINLTQKIAILCLCLSFALLNVFSQRTVPISVDLQPIQDHLAAIEVKNPPQLANRLLGLIRERMKEVNDNTDNGDVMIISAANTSRNPLMRVVFGEVEEGDNYMGIARKDERHCEVEIDKIIRKLNQDPNFANLEVGSRPYLERFGNALADVVAHEIGHLLCATHLCIGGGTKPGGCRGNAAVMMSDGRCIKATEIGTGSLSFSTTTGASYKQIDKAFKNRAREIKNRRNKDLRWKLISTYFEDGLRVVEGSKHTLPFTDSLGNIFDVWDPDIDFSYHLDGDTSLFEFGWMNIADEFVSSFNNPDTFGILNTLGGSVVNLALLGKKNTSFANKVFRMSEFAITQLAGISIPAGEALTPGIDSDYFSDAVVTFDVNGNIYQAYLSTSEWSDFNGFEMTSSNCDTTQVEIVITVDPGISPNEVSWMLLNDQTGDTIFHAFCGTLDSVRQEKICINKDESYTFKAFDDFGDGWIGGSYKIYDTYTACYIKDGLANDNQTGDSLMNCSLMNLEESFSFIAGGPIYGCTDPSSANYNPCATISDNTCVKSQLNEICIFSPLIQCGDTISGSIQYNDIVDSIIGNCSLVNNSPGVWYFFKGNGGAITLNLCNSNFDTKLAIFTGNCDSLVCVDSNDNFCAKQSQVMFTSVPGKSYFAFISGKGEQVGNFELAVSCANAPKVDLEVETPNFIKINNDSVEIIPVLSIINGEGPIPLEYLIIRNNNKSHSIINVSADGVPCNQVCSDSCSIAVLSDSSILKVYSENCLGTANSCNCLIKVDLLPLKIKATANDFIEIYIDPANKVNEANEKNNYLNFTIPSDCEPPDSLWVDSITAFSAILHWSAADSAKGYRISAGTNDFLFSTRDIGNAGTDNQYTSTQLFPATKHIWKVASICDTIVRPKLVSEFSTQDTFSTLSCQAPDSIFTDSISITSARLNWNVVQGVSGYKISGAPLGGPFTHLIVNDKFASTREILNLTSNNCYLWTIKSNCGTQESDFGPVDTFCTLPSSLKNVIRKTPINQNNPLNNEFDISIFPNPTKDKILIKFPDPISCKTSQIKFYSFDGKIIHLSAHKRDKYLLAYELSPVKNGVYFIFISNSRGVVIKRIVKID